jgi:putative glycosyltransferase (TIGR04372 family)
LAKCSGVRQALDKMIARNIYEIFSSMSRRVRKKPFNPTTCLNAAALLFVFFPSILFCFLQRIMSPVITIRIGKLRNQFYGHFLLESDYYFSKNINNNPFRSIDLFYFDGNSSNIFYQDLLRKQIYIFPKFVLQLVYFLNFYLFKNKKFVIAIPDRLTDLTELDEFNPSKIINPVSSVIEQYFKYNPKKSSVIFCLRESVKSYDSFSLRNVDVNTYNKSIDLLTSVNFDVYILTDTYIEHRSEKIIERIYRNSRDKGIASIEFFLASVCDFAVATDSGSFHLPYLFRKPIILTNICGPIGDIESRFIHQKTYKKWVDLDSKLNFDFSELKQRILFDNDHAFEENNIGLIDNTAHELKDAIELFLKNQHQKF